MHPLLTFASGLLLGVAGIRLLKTVKAPEGLKSAAGTLGDKARHGIDRAQTGLRDATVTGLSAIERSSANLRGRLAPAAPAEATPEPKPAGKRSAETAPTLTKPTRKRPAKSAAPAPEGGEAS